MKTKTAFADLYTYLWAGLTVVSRLAFNFFGMFNFAPVGPVSMFGGARISLLKAVLVALGMMVVSDLLLWLMFQDSNYSPLHKTRPVIYTAYIISAILGRTLVGESRSPLRIGGAALLAETQFFLITNYATWARGVDYPDTLAGLLAAYVAGLAFAKWGIGILFNLGFSAFLFAVYEPLARLVVIPEPENETALAK